MPLNFEKIQLIAPGHHEQDKQSFFDEMFRMTAMEPFSNISVEFLSCLSNRLLKNPLAKAYPDVITFAFWCRKSSLSAMAKKYNSEIYRLGRGVVFHVTPSNVPVNFAYSLAAGLLSGCINVVRVPTKLFPQVEFISMVVSELLSEAEFYDLNKRISLVRFEKEQDITSYFSSHADVRIIWGGDRSISDIRNSSLPARSFDLTFADRYSLCVINADLYINEKNHERIVSDFYNDTFLFDQNACTAPHLVIWLGNSENIYASKEIFWKELHSIVKSKYELHAVSSVNKYLSACSMAIEIPDTLICKMPDNLIVRQQVSNLIDGIDEYRSSAGFFIEYDSHSLNEVWPIVSRKYQTLSYFGLELDYIKNSFSKYTPCGIDRIVPIGKTTDFSLIWDGYDLINSLTRCISFS